MGDGIEAFEINEFDLETAYNPFMKRRRQTKHQQLYGVFADSDEDVDEDDRRGGRKKKDYTAPMAFISGGVKKGDKVEQSDDNDQRQEDEDEAPIQVNFKKKTKKVFGKGGKKYADETAFAGIRHSSAAGSSGASQGSWEKHTRGIGAKLLSKMGYVPGKGLGKSGQGITEPIQAALRPGRGAVGAYGREAGAEKNKQIITTTTDDVEELAEDTERQGNRRRWRKDGTRQEGKTKLRYKTLEEIVAADGGNAQNRLVGDHSSIKVIDMTGKEKKVFTGYEVFRYRTREPGSEDEAIDASTLSQKPPEFDVPELRHNLDILVDMTEEAIIQNDRQLKFLKDQTIALQHDDVELTKTIETEEGQLEQLSSIIVLLKGFEDKSDGGRASLSDCQALLKRLQQEFYEEYKMYGLPDMVVGNVLPLMKSYFGSWKPLSDPDYGYSMMEEWKSLLEEGSSNYTSFTAVGANKLEQMHPFHRLVWDCWLPSVRRCALSWNPRSQCDEMVNLVNHWLPLLPGWILENVLEQIVLPKLEKEVENWNPMTDTTPIHHWIHPWLPLMGDRLQPVYAPIRHKLGRALTQWHPSDPSAKNVLKPWKEVFALGAMQSFLSQYILPKLDVCLAEMQVNPNEQDFRPWHWVMDWIDMVNTALITDSLVKHFFPKWHRTLITWLNCRTANYNEITKWYAGWKSLIHPDIMAFQVIRDQFTHALEIMNQFVSTGSVHSSGYPGYSSMDQHRVAAEIHQRHMDMLAARSGGTTMPANFKDLVEKKAVEYGLLFMPIPNKFREGKPVYQFGSGQIYLDRNVVFQLQPASNQWIPVSLEQLVSSTNTADSMDRRDIIRLGLLPEFNYSQPVIFDEPERTIRKAVYRFPRPSCSRTIRSSTIGSSRTASPSTFSSSDMKEGVLAVLKRRFGLGSKRGESTTSTLSPSAMSIEDADERDGRDNQLMNGWHSRKRLIGDTGTNEDEAEGPNAKVPRKDHVGDRTDRVGVRNATQTIMNGVHVGRTVESVEPMDAAHSSNEINGNRYLDCTKRLKAICRRRLKRTDVDTDKAQPQQEDGDEEETTAALSSFKAGLEYERRKVSNLLLRNASSQQQRSTQPSMEVPIETSTDARFISLISALAPTISTSTTTGSSISLPAQFTPASAFSKASSGPPFAQSTSLTWSTGVTLPPIPIISPVSSERTLTNGTTINAAQNAPVPTTTVTASSGSDMAVTVTLSLPTSLSDPVVSSTFRLPAVTSAPASSAAVIGFNFTSAADTSVGSSFGQITRPSFNFASTSDGPPTAASSSQTNMPGFNFTFTAQPVSTRQFNFASPEPSTNIFSAVGSAAGVKRKPVTGSSIYSSRRRHR